MVRRTTVCAVLISGCCALALAAPVPKGAGANAVYFPTAVGARWVYQRPDRADETAEVTAVEKDGDALVVSRKGADGTATVYAKMIVSADGLRQERELTDGKVGWVLKAGLKPGDSWEVPDGGTRTVHGPELLEVPAGTFTCLRVVWKRADGTLTSWYAPGVGEVKRVEKPDGENERVLRTLKSFKLREEK
ncbi:MAG: hypothetical protein ACKODX_22005 [Gemmata sp.]